MVCGGGCAGAGRRRVAVAEWWVLVSRRPLNPVPLVPDVRAAPAVRALLCLLCITCLGGRPWTCPAPPPPPPPAAAVVAAAAQGLPPSAATWGQSWHLRCRCLHRHLQHCCPAQARRSSGARRAGGRCHGVGSRGSGPSAGEGGARSLAAKG